MSAAPPAPSASRIRGSVCIVGTGLLGASIGHGLCARGLDVILHDISPSNLRLALDYGAGRPAQPDDDPVLVVVAVPPDATAQAVLDALGAWPNATVTDVASVKMGIGAELLESGADLSRYVGSHPLAGRERGGAIAARADLFVGRPWVICAEEFSDARRIHEVEGLVLELRAVPVTMTAREHDASVAVVSHAPQVVSSLLASRLSAASQGALELAGQGLRDTTRIAASDPRLWVQILAANSGPVLEVLDAFRADLDRVIASLRDPDASGSRRSIADTLSAGNAGVARLPGKHGLSDRYAQLVVMVDDRPGELARLLGEVGEIGINMEDLRLEHSPGAAIGLAEISVAPDVADRLVRELQSRGWTIAGALT